VVEGRLDGSDLGQRFEPTAGEGEKNAGRLAGDFGVLVAQLAAEMVACLADGFFVLLTLGDGHAAIPEIAVRVRPLANDVDLAVNALGHLVPVVAGGAQVDGTFESAHQLRG
jgi:hypothetical protein